MTLEIWQKGRWVTDQLHKKEKGRCTLGNNYGERLSMFLYSWKVAVEKEKQVAQAIEAWRSKLRLKWGQRQEEEEETS
jgi:hypothetical protein